MQKKPSFVGQVEEIILLEYIISQNVSMLCDEKKVTCLLKKKDYFKAKDK